MDSKEFIGLFKDLIAHLYDYAAIETHPLTRMITPPPNFHGNRGEYLRGLILEEIERFTPEGKEYSLYAIEWRPYNILKFRYVDGESLRELSTKLCLSERQLRRDNNRALRALGASIQERLQGFKEDDLATLPEQAREERRAFDLNLEVLDLTSLVEGIVGVLGNRITTEGYQLRVQIKAERLRVVADRIITRQILISLVSYFLNFPCEDEIHLTVKSNGKNADVSIESILTEAWTQEDENDHRDLLEPAQFWSQRIHAQLLARHPAWGETGRIELIFSLPLTSKRVILVVDDQEPSHKMFQRFLSRSPYQIIGVTDPVEVLPKARQLQPTLITLDVMMPKADGWEILQALKMDTVTRDIPILVCSAWEEPELAQSLGAAGFIKKPIRQRDLLEALERLNL